MSFVERKGENLEELITNTLIELGMTRDLANIEVIEKGKKGLLGIGSKEAIIRISKKRDIKEELGKFLEEFFYIMNVEVEIKTEIRDNNIAYISISGGDLGFLIGKQGVYLESLQKFISIAINRNKDEYYRVILDIGNYKEKRKETLERLADKMAKKVISTSEKVELNPMNSYERRVELFIRTYKSLII